MWTSALRRPEPTRADVRALSAAPKVPNDPMSPPRTRPAPNTSAVTLMSTTWRILPLFMRYTVISPARTSASKPGLTSGEPGTARCPSNQASLAPAGCQQISEEPEMGRYRQLHCLRSPRPKGASRAASRGLCMEIAPEVGLLVDLRYQSPWPVLGPFIRNSEKKRIASQLRQEKVAQSFHGHGSVGASFAMRRIATDRPQNPFVPRLFRDLLSCWPCLSRPSHRNRRQNGSANNAERYDSTQLSDPTPAGLAFRAGRCARSIDSPGVRRTEAARRSLHEARASRSYPPGDGDRARSL